MPFSLPPNLLFRLKHQKDGGNGSKSRYCVYGSPGHLSDWIKSFECSEEAKNAKGKETYHREGEKGFDKEVHGLSVMWLFVMILGLVQVVHEFFHHLAGFGDEFQGGGDLVFVGQVS